jgi:hypothetical protein
VAACAAASSGWRSGAIRPQRHAIGHRRDGGKDRQRLRASAREQRVAGHTESNPASCAALANSTSPRASCLPVIAVSRLGNVIPTLTGGADI